MDSKGHSDEVWDGSGELCHWKLKDRHPFLKVAKNLAELCLFYFPSALQKIELVSNEIGYLAEDIFKHSVERTAWLFLIVYAKM